MWARIPGCYGNNVLATHDPEWLDIRRDRGPAQIVNRFRRRRSVCEYRSRSQKVQPDIQISMIGDSQEVGGLA